MPTPQEVVEHAIKQIQVLVPAAEVAPKGEAIEVRVGERGIVWNLSDVARLATNQADWRVGVTQLAEKVAQTIAASRATPSTASNAFDDVVILVWTQARLELLPFPCANEPIVPGLVLFYGLRGGGKIASIKPEELAEAGADLPTLRQRALRNLGLSFEALGFGPVDGTTPVFTNHTHHPCAASMLADTESWNALAERGPLLVAVPAPSRLFVAPDQPKFRHMLEVMVEKATEVEEELLSTSILRFHAGQWTLAS